MPTIKSALYRLGLWRVDRRRRARAFRRLVASAARPLCIHVGAGDQHLRGWINTDIVGPHAFLDATSRWPLAPASVDFVYADNFIEHVPLDAGRRFLAEARRALRPTGVLRLVTPDVERMARTYVGTSDGVTRLLDRHRRSGYRVDHNVDILRIAFAESEHWLGYLYDEAALSSELALAGFQNVRRQPLGTSDHLILAGLDSRTDAGDELHQMAIEAS